MKTCLSTYNQSDNDSVVTEETIAINGNVINWHLFQNLKISKTTNVDLLARVYEKNPEQLKKLIESEEEPSLSDLVQVKAVYTWCR